MSDADSFTITMDLQDDYRFLVDFDQPGVEALLLDEPEPLGGGAGPNASRLLAAAVANCMSASLLYCLERARIEVHGIHTTASGTLVRNDSGRLRIGRIDVRIEPVVNDADRPRMARCMKLFEDFCVVTQSVRSGVEVLTSVEPVSERPAR